jgi:NAD(P)-dependent dehydrogenase (short-subunit alcohol dehydrogenase family)
MRFHAKTIIITGGAGNFGKAAAKFFRREGANVVLIDSNQDALDEIIAEIEYLGLADTALHSPGDSAKRPTRRIKSCVCDVRDSANVDKSVAFATSAYGRIDMLWNNAGDHSLNLEPVILKDIQETDG